MPNAQGPGLCSTSVDKKDDHVCSMLVHVVCCNLIRVFFFFCGKKGVCCNVGAENLHPDCAGGALGCTDRDCCVNGADMLYHNQ